MRVDVIGGRLWGVREGAVIWEGERVKRRTPAELFDLVNEAINRRLDREITDMAFKGSKPGKGDGGRGKDQTDQLLRVIDTQSRVIEALAQAVMAASEVGGEEGEEEENEDEDKDKEE